jgi:hypothetical protein
MRNSSGMVSPHEQQASDVEINSSIENSGLLISRTLRHRKHQLRDSSTGTFVKQYCFFMRDLS